MQAIHFCMIKLGRLSREGRIPEVISLVEESHILVFWRPVETGRQRHLDADAGPGRCSLMGPRDLSMRPGFLTAWWLWTLSSGPPVHVFQQRRWTLFHDPPQKSHSLPSTVLSRLWTSQSSHRFKGRAQTPLLNGKSV